MKKILLSFTELTGGAFLFALSLTLFLDPASIVTGGVSGIAILLARVVPLSVGLLFLLLNLPILLIGLFAFGIRFMLATLYATALSSLFTELQAYLLAPLLPITENLILASLFGGLFCGIGLGLVLRGGGTTGGTDIGVRLLRLKFPHIREGLFFFIIDCTVVLASALLFRSLESALYSTVALIVCSKALDNILYGKMEEKLMIIITKKPETLGEALMKDFEVGITYLSGMGGWHKEAKRIILSAVKAKLYPKISDYISKIDPEAFMIVSSAKEVFGEGFSRNPKKHTPLSPKPSNHDPQNR